jgi:hypothetical protein
MLKFKESTPRSFRIDRAVAVAAMAATLTAVCAAPSFARHHHNNNAATSNTATETTTSVSPSGAVQTTVSTASVGINYRILSDQDLSYFAIKRAQAYGMSDAQIAQAAKLAHYAMVPMNEVLNRVETGCTIADLAMEYGVPLDTVLDSSDWQTRINDYMVAYNNTGWGALRNGPTMASVASYSSATPGMNNGMGSGPVISGSSSSTTMENNSSTTIVTPNAGGTLNNTTTTPGTGTSTNGLSGTTPNGTMNNSPGVPGNNGINNGVTNGTDNGTTNNGTTTTPGTTDNGTAGTTNGTNATPNGTTGTTGTTGAGTANP